MTESRQEFKELELNEAKNWLLLVGVGFILGAVVLILQKGGFFPWF